MKVMHVIAPVRFGGGESLLKNVVSQRRPGLSEHVVSLYRSDAFQAALAETGVETSTLARASLGEGLSKTRLLLDGWRWPGMLARLAALVRSWAPDVVHVHGFPAIGLWTLANAPSRRPAVYTHHSIRARPSPVERGVLGRAYRMCAARTAVSEAAARSMQAAFPAAGPFIAIPNCVGEPFFSAPPAEPFVSARPAGRAVALMAARFSAGKNHRLVVETLAAMAPAERAGLEVWMAGEGSERPAIEALVAARGLAGTVRFLGAVPYDAMPALVASVDYGLFPSQIDGFGIAAAECLAAGKPVLALDSEVMAEVVGGGGILVAPSRLGEGFSALLSRRLEFAAAARAAAERFRPAQVKDRYMALYREVLREARA